MKNHFSALRCFACGHELPATAPDYVCPVCGGNLEVRYDFPANHPDPRWWVDTTRRDIFRYSPLLPVSDLSLASPLRVGNTPLYPAPRLAAAAGLSTLYIKDDGQNPSASFKDRAGAVALVRARETGASVICGASTGNAGSSMACLAASVQFPCVIFVPQAAPPAKIAQLLVFGAKVIAVKGTYDDAFDLCMHVCAQRGWFNRNTGYNPYTREGKKTAAFELYEQLGRIPDWVAVPVGDGNIISGIWKGFRDLRDAGIVSTLPRLLCCQSEASDAITRGVAAARALGLSAASEPADWQKLQVPAISATTVADSISVDIPRDGLAAVRAVIESDGAAITVPDADILATIPIVARATGVFPEPAAATAAAGLLAAAKASVVPADALAVILSTGNGLKDIASARKAAGEPIVIENSTDAAMRATEGAATPRILEF
jgi:threonine synthase